MSNSEKTMPRKIVPKLLVGAFIVVVIVVLRNSELSQWLSLNTLYKYHSSLQNFVSQHYLQAIVAYMLVYIAVVAVSLPGAAILSVTGGFLFNPLVATLCIVVSASLGASLLFLAARYVLADFFYPKLQRTSAKLTLGLTNNAFYYLLFLRLMPLFPFFIVNIVPAFVKVSLTVFFFATLIGIIPAAFIFASFGSQIDSILDSSQQISLTNVFSLKMILILSSLALLSLLPIIYHKFKPDN